MANSEHGREDHGLQKIRDAKTKASDGVAKGIVMRIDAFWKPDYEFFESRPARKARSPMR